MLHLIEQKEKRKKLLIDPGSKFHSAIKKDIIDEEHKKCLEAIRDIPLIDISNLEHKNTASNIQKSIKEAKLGILDANFKDLMKFSQLNGSLDKSKNRNQSSIRKAQAIQGINHKPRKSISLPKLSNPHLRLSTVNSLNISQEPFSKCHLLAELISQLEQSRILTVHAEKMCIEKGNLKDLLNYVMCIALADRKNEVCNLKYTYQQFSNLDHVAQKIFYKLRQRKLSKIKPKMKICSSKVSFRYVPAKTKKTKLRVDSKLSPTKISLGKNSYGALVRDRTIMTQGQLAQSQELEEDLLRQFHEVNSKYESLKNNSSQYSQLLSSEQMKSQLGEIYPLQEIQKRLLTEIRGYFTNTLHDPLLVPDLKERLLSNLLSKVLNEFKFSISDFSETAERKCQTISLLVNNIRQWINKHQQKEECFLGMKKIFLKDLGQLLKLLAQLDKSLRQMLKERSEKAHSPEGHVRQAKSIVIELSQLCRSLQKKYRSDQFLFNG